MRKISKDLWGSLSVERESNLSMWLWYSLPSLSNHKSSWPFVFLSAKYLPPFYTHGKFLTLWAWWDSPFLLVQKVKLYCSCFYSLHCTEYTEFSSGSRKYLLWNLFGDLMREEKRREESLWWEGGSIRPRCSKLWALAATTDSPVGLWYYWQFRLFLIQVLCLSRVLFFTILSISLFFTLNYLDVVSRLFCGIT